MNVLLLNMPSGYPVKELHASLSGDHTINTVVLLPRKQFYSHDNQTGSYFSRKYRTKIEDEIIKFFPHADLVEMEFGALTEVEALSKDLRTKIETSVLCSINSHIRVSSLDELPPYWIKTFLELTKMSTQIYSWFDAFCKNHPNVNLYCFNGRFCEESAALEAIKANRQSFNVYDIKDHSSKTYYIFKNTSLHSFSENCKRAKQYYIKDIAKANKTAAQFMENKLNGTATYEKSYTAHQSQRFLKKNDSVISIFPSSDDEYRFLGEEWNGLVVNQLDEIVSFLKELSKSKTDYSIVIKMHPNMIMLPRRILEKYRDLKNQFSNVLLMDPTSLTNTYDVITKSDAVIVFCSTVGVEANYMRKRVIGIAGSPYSDLPIVNKARSGSEAANFVLNDTLTIKSKRASVIWMNYLWKYSDTNSSIIVESGKRYFGITVKTNDRISRLMTIFDRVRLISIQTLSGVFPTRDRVINLIKIISNK